MRWWGRADAFVSDFGSDFGSVFGSDFGSDFASDFGSDFGSDFEGRVQGTGQTYAAHAHSLRSPFMVETPREAHRGTSAHGFCTPTRIPGDPILGAGSCVWLPSGLHEVTDAGC